MLFWNDCIFLGLCGCMMIELGFRGRIEFEKMGMWWKSLFNRCVFFKNDNLMGDVLLDEVLKYIKEIDLFDMV